MAGNGGGAFTGLYQGSSGAADAAAALRPLLPNISAYQQGPSSAPTLQAQVTAPSQSYSSGGFLSNAEHFLGGLASETGHLVEGATSWLAHNAVSMVEAPYKLGEGIANTYLSNASLDAATARSNQTSAQLKTLTSDYKSGKITATQYKSGISGLNLENKNIQAQLKSAQNQITVDQKASNKAIIDTASAVLTIMTSGIGAAGDAAIKVGEEGLTLTPIAARSLTDYLTSDALKPALDPVVNTISKLATDSKTFQKLDQVTQNILQRSTAETLAATGANMTSAQIARATAVNLAFKYPIYFNYMSSTAGQIYNELDQGKYGDAVRTAAFNAALLLSGGPIGQALKYGGDVVKGLSERTFGKSSFWDELGKLHGTTDAYVKAITELATPMNELDRAEFLKNLSAAEAVNVHAMGGDAAAGASRVFNGMKTAYGIDMREGDPKQQIMDMVNLAKNMRLAQDTSDKLGLGQVVVGRFDARTKSDLADALTQTTDANAQHQAFKDYMSQHPNDPIANNASIQKQVNDLIDNSFGTADLRQGIMDIKAATTVEGFPQKVLDTMARDGYIPIKPKGLEAPFKEGTGKLSTATGKGEDFFTKSVQPLPVLSSVGALFTKLGLSPNASTQRVYGYFNDYVAKNLEKAGVIKALQGEDIHQASDTLLKSLSDYAHGLKVPATDLRMLTNKQIRTALSDNLKKVSAQEATAVQHAIAQAYIDIPLAVRGMGDRAVDWTYGIPGSASIARRYNRIQGALRFSFNPFFQYLRVIPKTEMLTEAKGGGYLSSVFAGRASQIADIRETLRSGGLLDEPGHLGNVVGGEAVDYAGSFSRNINKKLLPMQERSIAGLIDAQAQRMGMDWRDYIAQYPHETADTIQAIAGYSRNSNFLNSPLARTLNIAIFPFRFDAKVAGVFAHALANTSLLTQVSVINGLMKAHDFLNSPQGQVWYSQNSEAIGLFKYITPVASLSEAFQSLLPGHDHSLGNFGELGGLPFGWIPQILDSEGLTQFNQPGVDAKTGKPFPEYVPATTKGQAAIAVQDFIGMLFSYPGATIGLPSKTSITRNTALGLVGAKKSTDLQSVIPPISAAQQQYQQNVSQSSGQAQPTPSNFQSQPSGTTFVPPNSEPVDLASQLREKAKATKLKKSQITPIPAPGQSALGVL